MWRKGIIRALMMGMQPGAAAIENNMEFPQKTKSGTVFDTEIPLLGSYPKNPETQSKRTYAPQCS